MASCASRTSCSRLLAHDSPQQPCRQPRYTISRVPSLDGDGCAGMSSYSARGRSVSGTSTTHTIIRKQPYASSDLVVGGPSELGGDTKKRTTSMQKLLRCTGWMKNIDPRVERASSTTPPSLRHKSDVLDLRSLYERSSSGGSTDGTTERSSVTGDEDDGEWVTDDEGDDELGSQ